MAGMTPDQLAVFVAESCERQGVPLKVTDARVLADVAILLRGDAGKSSQSGRQQSEGDSVEQELRRAGS